MGQSSSDVEAVVEANLRFYQAFSTLDIAEMEKVWENSDRVLCIHPGWNLLVGWEPVMKSWEGIFTNSTLMHFNITDAEAKVEGNCGWVSCVENITSVIDGKASNFSIQATNVFVRSDDGWRIVHHHASP